MSPSASRAFFWRLTERVVWTAIQAGIGALTVEVADLPPAWAIPIAAAAAWVKGKLASRFGDPYDPATLPAGV